jgi:ribonuclease-3
MHKTLSYELVGEEGPDHMKTFYVDVLVDGKVCGSGKGNSKKAAEQEAAFMAMKRFKNDI